MGKDRQTVGFCFAVPCDVHTSTAPACSRRQLVGCEIVCWAPERALFACVSSHLQQPQAKESLNVSLSVRYLCE